MNRRRKPRPRGSSRHGIATTEPNEDRLKETLMARWYIIHAYSGFENKVRDSIISEAERLGLSDGVEAVEVPTETVTEVKRGKKVQVERKFMPGYVLAKLNLTDDVYHLVKNTPKVTGFLGSGSKPQAISEREAARYFGGVEEGHAIPLGFGLRRGVGISSLTAPEDAGSCSIKSGLLPVSFDINSDPGVDRIPGGQPCTRPETSIEHPLCDLAVVERFACCPEHLICGIENVHPIISCPKSRISALGSIATRMCSLAAESILYAEKSPYNYPMV